MIRAFHSTIVIFVVFTLLSGISSACTSSPIEIIETDKIPSQQDFRSAKEINKMLGKGINLGNALEAPAEGEWGMTIEKEYLKRIKDAGFQSVRIPIRWNAHINGDSPYTIDQNFLQRVDQVVGWAIDQELAVMINIHHFNEVMEEPIQYKSQFISIWKQVARHFKDHPENIIFEILNEPHSNLTGDLWNNFLKEAIDAIRISNPNRVLVAGTAPWGGFEGIQSLRIPEEERQVIVTVHYYNPFHFTHQGAEWVDGNSESWLGTTWTATESEKRNVDSDFKIVEQWAEENDRPIHVGEFGAYSKAPDSSRITWTKYIRTAAEKRGFSWAYWEFGAGFGVYDRDKNEWRTPLLDALVNDD